MAAMSGTPVPMAGGEEANVVTSAPASPATKASSKPVPSKVKVCDQTHGITEVLA